MQRFGRLAAAALMVLTAAWASPGGAEETVLDRPFDVESGVVVFKKTTTNPAMKIERTETLYFKDWGRVQARHAVETSSNKYVKGEQVSRSMSILDGATLTTVDLETNRGTRMKNPLADGLGKLTRPEAEKFAAELGDAMNTKTERVGEEEVAGKLCEVHRSVTKMGPVEQITRLCLWRNIPLKLTSSGSGTDVQEEATSVAVDVAIPEENFRLPANAQIMELGKQTARPR